MQNYNMPHFSPYMTPQQRLNYYEQNYPQFNQSSGQNFSNVISVSNIEEAKAFIVDIYGTPTFFYNANQKEVYLKQTNKQTGNADFFVFAKVEQDFSDKKEKKNTNPYEKDFIVINDKIDGIYAILTNSKEERATKPIITPKGDKKC